MARGGARPGAGRPKGARDKLDREAAEAAAAEGVMPLDFMLRVLRDETRADDERMEAAKNAAPYCHARLSSVEAAVSTETYEDRLRRLADEA